MLLPYWINEKFFVTVLRLLLNSHTNRTSFFPIQDIFYFQPFLYFFLSIRCDIFLCDFNRLITVKKFYIYMNFFFVWVEAMSRLWEINKSIKNVPAKEAKEFLFDSYIIWIDEIHFDSCYYFQRNFIKTDHKKLNLSLTSVSSNFR